jgi:hypothetical protein
MCVTSGIIAIKNNNGYYLEQNYPGCEGEFTYDLVNLDGDDITFDNIINKGFSSGEDEYFEVMSLYDIFEENVEFRYEEAAYVDEDYAEEIRKDSKPKFKDDKLTPKDFLKAAAFKSYEAQNLTDGDLTTNEILWLDEKQKFFKTKVGEIDKLNYFVKNFSDCQYISTFNVNHEYKEIEGILYNLQDKTSKKIYVDLTDNLKDPESIENDCLTAKEITLAFKEII